MCSCSWRPCGVSFSVVKVIFFHKATKTLLVTDCVICIPRDPPPVIAVEGLLQAAAEEGLPPQPDSPESRRQVCIALDTVPWAIQPSFVSGIVSDVSVRWIIEMLVDRKQQSAYPQFTFAVTPPPPPPPGNNHHHHHQCNPSLPEPP